MLNRGVDKRDIYMDDGDRVRFVHDLFVFNSDESANNTHWQLSHHNNDLRGRYYGGRKKLVDIHAWCIMRNHYHLLLSPRVENGITKFIMKLNVGYAKFFNEKYKRSGTLFQGRTKKVHITNDAHFMHILNYIHLNPLDYLSGSASWRTREIADYAKALAYLKEYRWSSYLDYCDIKNFPSIITKKYFDAYYANDYKKEISTYLKDIETELMDSLILE